jgi:quercetin dioxygenase-like cupin family protein
MCYIHTFSLSFSEPIFPDFWNLPSARSLSLVNPPTKKETELMTMTDQRLKTLVLGPQDYRLREPLDVLGAPGLVKLAGADTGNAVAVVHLTVPKLAGPPLHRHSREDEWFYVLDGELTWEVDGQRFTGGAGTSAFAPRGTAHAFQNFREEAAHILVMVTPAGLDQFCEDVTAQNKGLSQPDFARVEQLMQSYGMELLGPPLS